LLSPKAAVHIEVGAPVIKRYNFMVVGVNGSGKSTFCARLLRRYFPEFSLSSSSSAEKDAVPTTSLEDGRPTTTISERARCERVQGPNGNTRIIFTIVDSPGYGDTIDNQTDRFAPIEQYIRQQNEQYEERQVYRRPNDQSEDARIHCCFYFLMPHRVTKLDGGFMKRLQDMVPLVPIIAKADTYTTDEIAAQLFNLERCLVEYQITIFDFGENNQQHNNSTTTSHGTTTTTTRLTANKECGDHHQHHHVTTDDDDESTTSGSHGPTICPPEYGSIGGEPATTTKTSAVQPRQPHQQCPPQERPQRPNIFAVISGHRHYLWGVAREDDPHHSDTPRLHHVLFSSRHLHSLSRLQERANDLHEIWLRNEQRLVQEAERQRAELEQATKQRLVENVRLVWFILPLLFLLGCCFLLLARYYYFLGPTTTPATPSL
jgi:septin family protein